MSNIEEYICNDIVIMIKENLKLLIRNQDLCLTYLINYCKKIDVCDLPIDQELLTKFTEDALYALINANFLYDFRDGLE